MAKRYINPNYMDAYKKYYSGTSVAHEVYEDDEPYEQPKKRKRRVKKQRGTKYVYNYGKNAHSLATYLVTGIIFLGCLSCIFIYSFVWSASRKVNSLESQLKNLQEYNTTLNAGISASYDLQMIEKIARTKLNMAPPQPHQIVYINVPKESYIEQYKPVSEVDTQIKLSNIINILFKDWFNGTSTENK